MIAAVASAVVLAFAAGCYSPHIDECLYACAQGDECPAGFGCSKGRCASTGTACPAADANDDAPTDAPRPCNLAAQFDHPTKVVELSSTSSDGSLRLTDNELVAYFWSDRTSMPRIYTSTRASLAAAWAAPSPGSADINPITSNYTPAISSNGLQFVFVVNGSSIYFTKRPAPSGAFATPATQLTQLNTGASNVTPAWSYDGTGLYYATNPSTGTFDLAHATYDPSSNIWTNDGTIAGLNSAADELSPVVTRDELTIYWSSTRTDLGTHGGGDIFRATRTAKTGAWSNIEQVPELDTNLWDAVTAISADGCRIYLENESGTSRDLYVAAKPP